MMSNAMHSLGELDAKIAVKQGSVQMVTNLVDDDSEEDKRESLEEEGSFEGDHHHSKRVVSSMCSEYVQ